MNRRGFLTALGCTALVPLVPTLPRAMLVETARTNTVLWNASVAGWPSLVMDFANTRFEKDGVPCRMEDLVTFHGNARIDYDENGRCLGVWVGEGGGVLLKTSDWMFPTARTNILGSTGFDNATWK